MKCYTSKIKLETEDLNNILAKADHKTKSTFVRGIKAALYNIDDWLTDHREIFYDEQKSDRACKAFGNNIDPRDPNIEQEDQNFFQANTENQLWGKTVLPIRNILSEIIRDYIGESRKKNRLMGDYIHHLSMGIMLGLIHEENKCKKQQQQSESSWQDKENISNNPISNILSEATSKPKKSVSWAETVQKIKIPKEDGKTPS
jgi:hypothetical protein